MIRIARDILKAAQDPERDLSERLFIFFVIISEIALFLALAGDLIIMDNIPEIIVIIITIILAPLITVICFYKNRMELAINIIITGLVIIILPSIFFFGGGVKGGGSLWIIFAFMFVGLVMSGRWRKVMMVLLLVFSAAFYLVDYYHPELIRQHSRRMFFLDSFISLILVGVICYVMILFQNRFFRQENERARKEAERAEDLNRAQNRFFSSMSHEIRTPINSILGLNELILREEDIPDEVIKDANGIQGSGKMLLALINDILDFSKMEAGSMDIVPVDYRVGDLLSEVVNMVWVKAQEKGLDLKVSVDPNVPTSLFGDEVRIKQILINLLNNAVKYTKEGSVGLHMESEDCGSDAVTIRISVSDTGIGIKKESLPYLFDAFKRVDEEKNRLIEGTGLGLSIVKQLVELMDGTITVNSVYGEGSTFNVHIKQGVNDPEKIGELSIENYGKARKSIYESSFTAPEASVLIVDDNEMNLEVEKRLLAGTKVSVDTVLSGVDALSRTLKKRYDVILMDHLMPEMDGIECLEAIRTQTGGMNNNTSVVVLTANAGSENKDLYQRAGFDGYLVKPVSGEALEDYLMKHISPEKITLTGETSKTYENMSTTSGYRKKIPVVITSSSMCDLPDATMQSPYLPILPFDVFTDEGTFKDGLQIDADEMLRYMDKGKKAASSPPDVSAYIEFFAEYIKNAHHLIYIALAGSMSSDYQKAMEAARSFDNVTVIDSEALSSATGILVLIACKLAQQDTPVEEMIEHLERVKKRLRCSFIIDSTEYMARRGFISQSINKIAGALSLRPGISVHDGKGGIGSIYLGSWKHAYKRYIRKAFSVDVIPDEEVLFITYAGVPEETLLWIREEISKIEYFERVIFQKASAGITSNCGPGTFGVLYFVKGNKSYNITSILPPDSSEDITENAENGIEEVRPVQEETHTEISPEPEDIQEEGNSGVPAGTETASPEWYENIEGIDGKTAIKNSGSAEAFKTVLKIFYDSLESKSEELEKYFDSKNWDQYTIKIHALKSSAKLVGALELSDMARDLEMAGKEGNSSFINENHGDFMEKYRKYKDFLSSLYSDNGSDVEAQNDKPLADKYLMESVYEAIKEGASALEADTIDEALNELADYRLSAEDEERIQAIRDKARIFDYDGIIEILGNNE